MSDIEIKDSKDLTAWLRGIEDEFGDMAIEVIEEVGEFTQREAVAELRRIERKGKLSKGRLAHMHQDVIIKKAKKGRTVHIKGGLSTGNLWHIVNDGTYRSRAHHFMDKIMPKVEKKINEIMNKKERSFNGK